MRRVVVRNAALDGSGLSGICRLQLHALGHRGSRLVYVAPPDQHQWAYVPNSGLRLFAVEDVFRDHNSILLGCGVPNVYTAVYSPSADGRQSGWRRFAAYMCWRNEAHEARVSNRLQAGVIFEMRNLPEAARMAVLEGMRRYSGRSSVSCAYLNLVMLAQAGFTLGNGRRLWSVRPTRLASLIWRHGLCYQGDAVDLRVVVTGADGVGDHFARVWRKEFVSACRLVAKRLRRGGGERVRPPRFTVRDLPQIDDSRWQNSARVDVSMSRPSWLGVKMAFMWGQHPLFGVALGQLPANLRGALKAFDGKLPWTSRLKQYGPFSPIPVAILNHLRNAGCDIYCGLPAHAVLEMLTPSASPDHDSAMLYNCVVACDRGGNATATVTSLKNGDPRSQRSRWIRVLNWVLAKHVAMSNYSRHVAYACELWTWVDPADGRTVLFINRNSGTYRPTEERMFAFAEYLSATFDIEVRAVS